MSHIYRYAPDDKDDSMVGPPCLKIRLVTYIIFTRSVFMWACHFLSPFSFDREGIKKGNGKDKPTYRAGEDHVLSE